MSINDVSLTSGMRSNLLSLQGTVGLLDRTQNRLSSGKKVNSAIDNPVSFFAAQALNSRASVIDSLKDAMGQAVQTITSADKGITAITSMIEQSKGIAQSALSAEAGTGGATGVINMAGVAPAQGTVATGHITLSGMDPLATAPDTGAINLTGIAITKAADTGTIDSAFMDLSSGKNLGSITITGMTAGQTVVLSGVTFTAVNGAVVPGSAQFDMRGTDAADGNSLKSQINAYGWGATAYTAVDLGAPGEVVVAKRTAGGAQDVVLGDIDVTGSGGHAAKSIRAGSHEQITIGGLVFTAVAVNPIAALGEFATGGFNAADEDSLRAAINAVSWAAETYTFSATISGGHVAIAKTVTATAAAADVVAGDVITSANSSTAVVIGATTPDTLTIGGLTFTAVAANPVAANRQFLASGNDATDEASLRDAINATNWSAQADTFSATINGGQVEIAKTVTATLADVSVLAGDVTIPAHGSMAVVPGVVTPADTIVIGDVTFTAVAANPVAANGEFLASGNNATDMASLAQAINDVTYASYTGNRNFTANFANGVLTISKTVNGADASVDAGDFVLGTATAGEASLTVDAIPTADTITIGQGADGITFTAIAGAQFAGDLNFTAGGDDAADKQALADAINSANWSAKTYTFTASINNGNLALEKTINPGGAAANVTDGDFTYSVGISNTGAASQTINTTELANLQDQYNELRDQLTAVAVDSGYKGKNLLSAIAALRSMDVKFEGNSLIVQGFDATADGLGLSAATWTAGGSISADTTKLDNALSTLSQNSSKLSGNLSIITVRQGFSTDIMNTLTEGADKLTLADANEEGGNMLMLQTRQSLSTSALSMSAQAAQSVLRLFQ